MALEYTYMLVSTFDISKTT